MVIWLTGLPCSGKTTIALALQKKIEAGYCTGSNHVEILDGDQLRHSDFARDVGFLAADRDHHLKRVGYMAKRLSLHVPVVICAFVSPNRQLRQYLRTAIPINVLVHVDCPAQYCILRDVKGMWQRAIQGEIQNFTGFDAPYEPPPNPNVYVDTSTMNVDACVRMIWEKMRI